VPRKEILDRIQKYVHPFRITKGNGFRLKDFDPGDTRDLRLDKGEAADLLQRGTEWLAEEQDMLYAQDRCSVLLVFQAMDAAGKDSTIKHVMSGVNPQGCQVFSFKQPSSEDLSHDFLWRYFKCLPERGRIGIFNRSYYEEVLVVRVHPDILKRQKLPPASIGKRIWDERLVDIAHFEDYLTRQGTIILKFFYTSRARSRRSASSSASIDPRSTGSSPPQTSASDDSGGTTCTRSKKRSRLRRRSTRRGSLCLPITSGSVGSSSPLQSWKRWRTSTLATRRSMRRRRRNSRRRVRRLSDRRNGTAGPNPWWRERRPDPGPDAASGSAGHATGLPDPGPSGPSSETVVGAPRVIPS
jgi:polyphosphate kinase 2 (PPK2 family)